MPIGSKKVHGWWFIVHGVLFFLILLTVYCSLYTIGYTAPCYGTKMPKEKKFFAGAQTHTIFKRYLEDEYGKLRSTQHFFLLSYGVCDGLSIDLKAGAGNIKQHPVGSDEVDYNSNFSGGYGLRVKFLNQDKIKAVFGFQHISAHPKSSRVGDTRHKAILDDWQWSLLASYDLKKIIPYLGSKWSRVDYIHKVEDNRKRRMSDLTKDIGLVTGIDFSLTQNSWLNLEGQFIDGEALAVSFNYSF